MKLLVTGAEGFIGSHLVLNLGVVPIRTDVTHFEPLRNEIEEKSAGESFTLFHCAAITDVEKCERDKRSAWDVNVKGTQNVLEAISPLSGRVILLSTCHVFSGNRYFPYAEIHSPNPVNFYGTTKFAAEAVSAIYRVPSLVVRLGKIYDGNTMQKVLLSDEPVPSFLKRNFTHVEDIVNVLGRIAQMDFSVFPTFKKLYRVLHIGNPNQNFTYSQFYNIVRARFGKPPVETRMLYEKREAERPMRCTMNVTKMQKLIDYSFRVI